MRFIVLILALAAGPALSQTLSGDAAEQQLFPTRGIGVAVSRDLSAGDQAVVRELARQAEQAGQSFRYYGSIAFSPSEGLQSASLQGAFNFHGIAAADAAALAACENVRAGGSAGCVIAGRILPAGWERRPLQLSYDATRAFRRAYVGARAPKALAISPGTGAWSIAQGESAAAQAIAACNRDAAAIGGVQDCEAAVAN